MSLLTPRQAARELGISLKHLQHLSRDGAIAFIDVGRSDALARRYDPQDIAAFLAARRTLQAPAQGSLPRGRLLKSGDALDLKSMRQKLDARKARLDR